MALTGANLLRTVSAIKVTLENGAEAEIKLDDEITIPKNASPQRLIRELERSTASYAFWSYQSLRAGRHASKLRRKYEKIEGRRAYTYRVAVENTTEFKGSDYKVRDDLVKGDRKLVPLRAELEKAEEHSRLLQQVAECLRQRLFALNRIIDSRSRRDG